MDKETEVENLLSNLEDKDLSNATQACRELKELLQNSEYEEYFARIEEALEDAGDAWGDPNCENWAGTHD